MATITYDPCVIGAYTQPSEATVIEKAETLKEIRSVFWHYFRKNHGSWHFNSFKHATIFDEMSGNSWECDMDGIKIKENNYMKPFNGYDNAKKAAENTGSAQLPAGAYICKVMNVKFEEFDWGNRISVQFDVAEGEYKDFYKKQYEANTADDKKWKGVARISVPTDDGSEQDEKTKKRFANWTNGFEKSNKGYTWDWDENKWKGLTIGILFRQTGNVIEGKEVKYTEATTACTVEQVKTGKYWDGWTKFYAKNGYTGTASVSDKPKLEEDEYGFVNIPDDIQSEAIPF